MRTYILKRLLILRWLRHLRIDPSEYELHLQVISQVLKPLDLALQPLNEILHVATVQTFLFLFLWSARTNYLDDFGGSRDNLLLGGLGLRGLRVLRCYLLL